MARQNNDSPAVPQDRRKTVPTGLGKDRGGKWTADDEQVYQQDLFGGTAASDAQASAKCSGRSKRNVQPVPEVRKPPNKIGRDIPATMELIVEQLEQAQRNVVANRGSPGPNRQTVEMVREHWNDIKPKLVSALLGGRYQPGDIRRVWIPKSGGGERGLGIPDVIDRIVQEATRMCIQPLYEPIFHQNSHGFRPRQLKQWKRKRTIARNLIARGKAYRKVIAELYGKKSRLWALSHTPVVDGALNNRYWLQRGLRPLFDRWSELKQAEVAPIQMALELV